MDAGSLNAPSAEGQRQRFGAGDEDGGGLTGAIGLMSGTSLDGIDIAYLETDGEARIRRGPRAFTPYSEEERALLRAALEDAASLIGSAAARMERPGRLAEAEAMLNARHVAAVKAFLISRPMAGKTIGLIGFHGQTVLHRPESGLTVQLGDGAALARALNLPVAYDFRQADVASGGEGAPLVPIYHQALARAVGLAQPLLVINIGGVANITYIDGDAELIACDCGPGNALIDDLMRERQGIAMDKDGMAAAQGRVDDERLADLLAHPFFQARPPKSLDRNAFSRAPLEGLGTEDAAATLTAFTASGIASVLPFLPRMPQRAIICGGGARNPTLMAMLREKLGCPVESADSLGWSVDAMEAQAFAYLAVRCKAHLPITFPLTTGVKKPLAGGVIAEPDVAPSG